MGPPDAGSSLQSPVRVIGIHERHAHGELLGRRVHLERATGGEAHALGEVRETGARPGRGAASRTPVVRHDDRAPLEGDRHVERFVERVVLDGVLEQHLQADRRDEPPPGSRRLLHDPQPIPEPLRDQPAVRREERELVLERDEVLADMASRIGAVYMALA